MNAAQAPRALVYLDTSVVLAELLDESRRPPASLWSQSLVTSRLLQYEVCMRLNDRKVSRETWDLCRDIFNGIAFIELLPAVLARSLEPFPKFARTLGALHLSTALFVSAQGPKLSVAAYDQRFIQCAQALDVPIYELS